MSEWIISILMWIGGIFMFLAAVGIVRLPDLYTRMHAATKVGTLGVSGLILAAAVYFNQLGVTTQSLLIIAFFYLTSPIAAHMISRAAYYTGVPLSKNSVADELAEKQRDDRSRAS